MERRVDPRFPVGFSIWVTDATGTHTSAWVLNLSIGGAALLMFRESAPRSGDAVELSPMPDEYQLVYDELPSIARFARVLRIEDADGPTCRVAVRFESNATADAEPRPTDPLIATASAPEKSLLRLTRQANSQLPV